MRFTILAIALLIGTCTLGKAQEGPGKDRFPDLVVGQPFPSLSGTTVDGKAISLAACKGKVVLVDFWATWCGPCVRELPNVKAAYEKYHAKGFDVVAVSLDENKAKLTEFIAAKKIPWPQIFDGKGWENAVAKQFKVQSIPAAFLIDREGRLVAKSVRGPALEEALAKAIAK
jgi:peroxiredoxin